MSNMRKLSDLDTTQMNRAEHQADCEAKRVYVVGGELVKVNVDTNALTKALQDSVIKAFNGGLNNMQPQQVQQQEPTIITIDKPFIVREKEIEIREVQVPVIVRETQIKEIEKPVLVIEEKIKVIETEKTVFIDRPGVIPVWVKYCFIGQTLCLLALLISRFVK